MKKLALLAMAVCASLAFGRDTPITNGKLTSDLNANGYSITNLPTSFFPTNGFIKTESDPTVPSWAKSPTPPAVDVDLTTNNQQLVDTITAVAPTPGDYANVSNAAMNAAQNATNLVVAATNDIPRVRESDVYEGWAANAEDSLHADWASSAATAETAISADNASHAEQSGQASFADNAATADWASGLAGETHPIRSGDAIFAKLDAAASAAQVTNIVRALSLGGIWDSALQVWWTPRMVNGSLTYHATTNVNLNAEN